MIAEVALLGLSFVASIAGVELFRRWSVNRNLLDIPNERSSHSIPTPRGGGIVIVAVTLTGYLILTTLFDATFSWGYFAGALIIAIVSWLDDLYSLPFWSRLIMHILGAVLLTWDLGSWNVISVPFFSAEISLGQTFGLVCTIGWLVWMVNAYNFMDGIDGIAALQAFIAAAGWASVSYGMGLNGSFIFAGVLASAAVGFLVHNWQPARIFMGDVGSAFIGFTVAAMPIIVAVETTAEMPFLPVVAVVFVWFFVLDTILTLVRRIAARERIWEAHRQHIYQRMVARGLTHATVSMIYGSFAGVLVLFTGLSLFFGGIFYILAVSSLLFLTTVILYAGFRKKR